MLRLSPCGHTPSCRWAQYCGGGSALGADGSDAFAQVRSAPGGPKGSLSFTTGTVCAGSIPTVLEMALPILVKVFPGGAVLSPKWAQHWGHLVGRISSGDRLKWFSLSLRGMPAQGPPKPSHYKGRGSGRCGQ